MTPAHRRAALAKVNAEILALEQRRERLEESSGPPGAVELELARVDARLQALAAEREDVAGGAPAEALPAPAEPVPPASEYLDTRAAAALLGMTPKALEGLRARGTGPAYLRIGRAIRYRRADLVRGSSHGSR